MNPAPLGPRSSRVAAARKLLRRSVRRSQGLMLLEGPAAVGAAIDAGFVRELFATATAAQRHAPLLAKAAVSWQLLTDPAAAALSETVTPQGLIAIAPIPAHDLREVLQRPERVPGHRLIAVLMHVSDPGNAGTVIRSADAAGADCVVLAGSSVDPWSGKCIRASAGSVLHLPVIDGIGPDEAFRALRASGLRIVAADGHAESSLHSRHGQDLITGDIAWVFGNEAQGFAPEVLNSADFTLRVPVYGRAESLNLAAAAAVCLYESARAARPQRAGGQGREEVR